MGVCFLKEDFDFFKSLLFEAGSCGLSFQKDGLRVSRKLDASIVTQADISIQEMLMMRISARYPGIRFVYEENFDVSTHASGDDAMTAIIDPIDGTAMYSMYLPIWCVSVGIFEGFKPKYGFVYSPGFDMFFYNDDDSSYLNGRLLRVDPVMTIDTETNIFYSSEIRFGFIKNFPGKVRNLGSTALHACLTADNTRNRVLAFVGKSYLWDWAGAIPIIRKAGGRLRYLNGDEPDIGEIIDGGYELKDYLIAYNHEDFGFIQKMFGG